MVPVGEGESVRLPTRFTSPLNEVANRLPGETVVKVVNGCTFGIHVQTQPWLEVRKRLRLTAGVFSRSTWSQPGFQ